MDSENPSVTSGSLNIDKKLFIIECPDCSKFFKTKFDCDQHKLKNNCTSKSSFGNFFECAKCKKRFEDESDCLQHVPACLNDIQENVVYECHRCKRKFKSKYSCQRHVYRKICEKKKQIYQCHYCSLIFSKRNILIKHVHSKICLNIKNQKCFVDNCNVYFRKREQLIDHLRVAHKNESTFEGSNMNWYNMEVEQLKFTNQKAFLIWLEIISNEYNCNYFSYNNKVIDESTSYKNYRCQYDKRTYPNKIVPYSRLSNPNLCCPSRVCSKIVNGRVSVTYYKTHNHEPFHMQKRNKLIRKGNKNLLNQSSDEEMDSEEFDNHNSVQTSSNTNFNPITDAQTFVYEDDNCWVIEEKPNDFTTKSSYEETNDHVSLIYENVEECVIYSQDNEHVKDEEEEEEQQEKDKEEKGDDNSDDIAATNDSSYNEETINVNDNSVKTESIDANEPKIENEEEETHSTNTKTKINNLKCDISNLFSNILEYVEISENIDFLIKTKNDLSSILNNC